MGRKQTLIIYPCYRTNPSWLNKTVRHSSGQTCYRTNPFVWLKQNRPTALSVRRIDNAMQ